MLGVYVFEALCTGFDLCLRACAGTCALAGNISASQYIGCHAST
jgi:hypothetical protein